MLISYFCLANKMARPKVNPYPIIALTVPCTALTAPCTALTAPCTAHRPFVTISTLVPLYNKHHPFFPPPTCLLQLFLFSLSFPLLVLPYLCYYYTTLRSSIVSSPYIFFVTHSRHFHCLHSCLPHALLPLIIITLLSSYSYPLTLILLLFHSFIPFTLIFFCSFVASFTHPFRTNQWQ